MATVSLLTRRALLLFLAFFFIGKAKAEWVPDPTGNGSFGIGTPWLNGTMYDPDYLKAHPRAALGFLGPLFGGQDDDSAATSDSGNSAQPTTTANAWYWDARGFYWLYDASSGYYWYYYPTQQRYYYRRAG